MLSDWRSKNCRIFLYRYVVVILGASGTFANEFGVYKAITADYDKNVRPVRSISTTTVVSVELTYFTLLSMDQIQETIMFMTELEMIWKDEFADWNKSAFGDTSSVLIPASLLWKPDIIVTTGLKVDYMTPDDKRVFNVLSDGTVRSSAPCVITNQCRLSIEKFPYDVQTCTVTLGSWMYSSTQIDLVVGHKLRPSNSSFVDTEQLTGNGEWTLLSFDAYVNYTYDLGLRYTELTYTIRLKRQPIYYICVLLIPTFMTATICLLGLFVPAMNTGERIEKVNMGLATLLSMAVILGIVAGNMPKTTTLPLLGYYVLAELFLCTVGVGFSMLIMVAHQRARTRLLTPPRWINMIILFTMKTLAKPEKTEMMKVYTEKTIWPVGKDEKMKDPIENIKNSIYARRLNQVLDNVEDFIGEQELEDYLVLQWIIIFDRIDTFFLVLFNFVNLVMSCILLIKE